MGKIRQDIEVERGKASRELKAYARDLERVFKDAQKSSSQSTSKIEEGWKRALGNIKTWIAATFSVVAVAGFTRSLLRLNGELEQVMTSFRQLTGSQERANQLFKDLEKFAAKTPFQFTTLAKGTQQLLAFGFAAEDIIDILKDVGDAASASPDGLEQGLTRIIRAFGQIRARGRLMGQEILQLTEAGIPVLEILADKFDTTTAEISRMVERGLLPANAAISALREGLSDRFGGLQDAQSQTLVGLTSTLRDLAEINLRQIGQGLFSEVKSDLKAVVDELDRMSESGEAARVGTQIGDAIRTVYTYTRELFLLFAKYGPAIARVAITLASIKLALAMTPLIMGVARAFQFLGLVFASTRGNAILLIGVLQKLRALIMTNPWGVAAAAVAALATQIIFLRRNAKNVLTDFIEEANEAKIRLGELSEEQAQFNRQRLLERRQALLLEKERIIKTQRDLNARIDAGTQAGNYGFTRNRDANAALRELQEFNETATPRLEAIEETFKRMSGELVAIAELEVEARRRREAAERGNKDDQPDDPRPISDTTAEELRLERLALDAKKEELSLISEIAAVERRLSSLRKESAEKQMSPDALRELGTLIDALASKKSGLESQLTLLRSLPESARAFIEILGGLDALVSNPALAQSLENAAPIFERIAKSTTDFRDRALALRVKIDATTDPTAKKQLEEDFAAIANEFRALVEREFIDAIENLDLPQDVKSALLTQISNAFSPVPDKAQEARLSIEAFASTGRAVVELGRALGIVNDELDAVARGAIQAFDNVAQLSRVREDLRRRNVALNSTQGVFAQLPAILGIATGFARIVNEFRNPAKETAQQERMRETMERLRQEFERASKDIVAAIDRFTDSRVGTSESGGDVQNALSIVTRLIAAIEERLEGSASRERDAELRDLIFSLTQELEDSGLGIFEGIRAILSGTDLEGFLSGSGDFPGLQELRDTLAAQGRFEESVRGIIADLDLFRSYISDDANAALSRFVQNLLGLDSVSDDLRDRLAQIATLDPTTDAGRRAIEEILSQIAQDSSSANDGTRTTLLGGLSPSEIEDILSTLSSLLDGSSSAGTSVTAGTSVNRSITEVQSNTVVSWLQEIAFWVKDSALSARDLRYQIDLPAAAPSSPWRGPHFTDGSDRGFNIQVGDVNVSGFYTRDQLVQDAGRAFMQQLDTAIRRKERRAF